MQSEQSRAPEEKLQSWSLLLKPRGEVSRSSVSLQALCHHLFFLHTLKTKPLEKHLDLESHVGLCA